VAELLRTKDRARRFEVCRVLVRIEAAEAKKAVPPLIEMLRPDKVEDVEDEEATKERGKARELLAGMGKPAVKALLDALENDFSGGVRTTAVLNAAARLEVVKALTEIGAPAGSNDVLLVLARLQRNDSSAAVRQAAREARVKLQKK
jgi:hypothetical protein